MLVSVLSSRIQSGSGKRVYRFPVTRSYLARKGWRLLMAAYLANSLIKSVLKPFEGDSEILLLNFLMYFQIARRYL